MSSRDGMLAAGFSIHPMLLPMMRPFFTRAIYVFASLFSAVTILFIGAAGAFVVKKGSAPWYVAANEVCLQTAKAIGARFPCVEGQIQSSRITDRMALWNVVDQICVPMKRFSGLPFPCQEVDEAKGYAVISSPLKSKREDLVIVPTAKIGGIEDPVLLKSDTPNYWMLTWEERGRIKDAAGRPLTSIDIGMAVNSKVSRTQDQLHIHLGCVDRRLKQALALWASALRGAKIPARWSPLDLRPWAGEFLVRRLSWFELEENVFQLVREEVPGAKEAMESQTFAVVGVPGDGEEDFALLVNSKGAAAEFLLGKCE